MELCLLTAVILALGFMVWGLMTVLKGAHGLTLETSLLQLQKLKKLKHFYSYKASVQHLLCYHQSHLSVISPCHDVVSAGICSFEVGVRLLEAEVVC